MNLIYSIKDINSKIKQDKQLKPALIIAILSFLGIFIIKAIRPYHFELTYFQIFLQGTLPNFFAAVGFCVLGFNYSPIFFQLGNLKLTLNYQLIFAFLFSFGGLTIWEAIQYFMGFPIDYYDILMTAIGSAAMTIFIKILKSK